jgi:hypothetical protein
MPSEPAKCWAVVILRAPVVAVRACSTRSQRHRGGREPTRASTASDGGGVVGCPTGVQAIALCRSDALSRSNCCSAKFLCSARSCNAAGVAAVGARCAEIGSGCKARCVRSLHTAMFVRIGRGAVAHPLSADCAYRVSASSTALCSCTPRPALDTTPFSLLFLG